MSSTPPTAEVFLSSAEEDSDLAELVRSRLQRDGMSVWHFSQGSRVGPFLSNEIRILASSRLAVFILTPSAAKSRHCLDEAERAANPSQPGPLPLPVVVGEWDHLQSDIWLLLRKWQALLAPHGLGWQALNSLAGLAHDSIGRRPVAALSTGQALVAVKEDLCAYLASRPDLDIEELFDAAIASQARHRGKRVSFFEFTHLQRELDAVQLLPSGKRQTAYIGSFLDAFFDGVVAPALVECAQRLTELILENERIAIGEYSRVILTACELLSKSDPDRFATVEFSIISRVGLAQINDEPLRMAEALQALGAKAVVVPFGDWIRALMNSSSAALPVDKILVGVEAFTSAGDVIFPQIVKDADQIRLRQATSTGPLSRTAVIAAGEAYKVCRTDTPVSDIMTDTHYSVLHSDLFDFIVTDIGKYAPDRQGKFAMADAVEHIDSLCDRIRRDIWPSDYPLPLWNLPKATAGDARFLACDIDGTITDSGKIAVTVLEHFELLADTGVRVLLVTGRSAGWASALSQYLPGVAGIVSENGSVFINNQTGEARARILEGWTDAELASRMFQVAACIEDLRTKYPQLRESADNFTRLTDAALWLDESIPLAEVRRIAASHGLNHTYSSIHHHIRAGHLEKDSGLAAALFEFFGLSESDIAAGVITVGDGYNDAPLFRQGRFLATVGVRGVLSVLDELGRDSPDYVTIRPHADGVIDLIKLILPSFA